MTTTAGVEIEPIWATLLAKALEGKNVKEMLSTIGVGSGTAAPGGTVADPVKDAAVEAVDAAPATDGNDSDDDEMDGMVRTSPSSHPVKIKILTPFSSACSIEQGRISG